MKNNSTPSPLTQDRTLTLIVLLFHFLVFATPLFFTFNTSELFEFNKMVLTYAVTVLIAGAWLTRMAVHRQFIIKRTYLDIPIALFVISQFISTIFSMHPPTSWLGYYSRFHGGLLSTLTYVVLYYAFASNLKKKHLPALLLTTLMSGTVVSIYAALEHFGHSFSCFLVDNGRSFGVDCWIQDVKNRVFASFGQPNWLAAYLIMLIPMGVALVLKTKQKSLLRYTYTIVTALFFLVLLYTQSRSGFFGLAIGAVVFISLLIIKWQLWQRTTIKELLQEKQLAFWGLVGSVLIIAAVNGTPVSPAISSLRSTSVSTAAPTNAPQPVVNRLDIGGTDSGEIRKIVWEGAIKVWQRYPWFGSGVETFAYSYYLDRPVEHNLVSEWDFLYNKAHNEFLNYLATTGTIGLLAYLSVLAWFFLAAIKTVFNPGTNKDHALLTIGLISGTVALSVSNFFGFSTVMVTILMYIFFAVLSVLIDTPLTLDKTVKKITEVSYLYFSIIAMACVFLLNMIFQYWKADVLYSRATSLLNAGYYQEGMTELLTAINKNPGEAEFYDQLATQYSRYAYSVAQQNQLEDAQQLMVASLEASDRVMQLNPHQLNFYKTRAGVFITLAQLQPALLNQAKDTLLQGTQKAPTDAKLLYNLGIVEISLDNPEGGITYLEKAVEMKPNYEAARIHLANTYETVGKPEKSIEHLQYIVEKIAPHNQVAIDKIASLSAKLKQTRQ